MTRKRNLIYGMLIGLLVGAMLTGTVLGRYTIQTAGPYGLVTVRMDRWTGRTEIMQPTKNRWERVLEYGEPRFVFEPCLEDEVKATLLDDPKFQALSPEAKRLVVNRLCTDKGLAETLKARSGEKK